MRISVVIVCRNEERDLEGTVTDFCRTYFLPHEIIVVDDHSVLYNGLTVQQRLERFELVKVIRPDTQLGAGLAKRAGCLAATGDVVVICDSHLRVPDNHLELVQEAVEEYPDAIFCPTCVGFDGRIHGAGARWHRRTPGFLGRSWLPKGNDLECDTCPCLLGAYYMVPRHIGEAIDWICPHFQGWGCGEQWMSLMAWLNGFEVRRINRLHVAHRFSRGLIVGTGNLSTWHNQWNTGILLVTLVGLECFRTEFWPYLQAGLPKQQERDFCAQLEHIETWAREVRAGWRYDVRELLGICGWRPPTRGESEAIRLEEALKRGVTGKVIKPSIGKRHLEAILDALPPNGRMLEWGSGGSTLWFRARLKEGQELVTVEHNKEWASKIDGTMLHEMDVPLGKTDDDPNAMCPYVECKGLGMFDVILVDGVLRNACLKKAPTILNKGGSIFLHDSQRNYLHNLKPTREWPPCPDCRGPRLMEAQPC